MGQMGEDQRATPDVAEPVKESPSASSAPYDVAPPLPRESVAGKPWKEAGRSHLAAAARVEASSSTLARVLGMHHGSQARRLRERAKAARRTARALAPLTGQGSVIGAYDPEQLLTELVAAAAARSALRRAVLAVSPDPRTRRPGRP